MIYEPDYKVYEQQTNITGEYSQCGLLNAITYPTKGRTEFEYEPHRFSNLLTVHPHHSESYRVWKTYFTEPDNYYVTVAVDTIIVPSTKWFTFFTKTNYDGELNPGLGYIESITGQPYYHRFRNNGSLESSTSLELAPGVYTLNICEISYGTEYYNTDITTSQVFNDPQQYISSGFGNRIKSINNFDTNNSIISQKNFSYLLEGINIPSGKLLTRARNFYIKHRYMSNSTDCLALQWSGYKNIDTYLIYSSRNTIPVGLSYKPNAVGYSRVCVTDGINGGKTVYNYHNITNNEYQNKPYYGYKSDMINVPEMYDPRNGQLLSVEFFDKNDNPVKKITNSYNCKDFEILKGVNVFNGSEYFGGSSPTWHDIAYYDNISAWWVQDSTIETNYFDGQAVSKTTIFNYDNNVHKQLTSKETNQSDGMSIIETFKYPSDYNSGIWRYG